MTPKEYLICADKSISDAVYNGYDIRLTEDELLQKMQSYTVYTIKEARKKIEAITLIAHDREGNKLTQLSAFEVSCLFDKILNDLEYNNTRSIKEESKKRCCGICDGVNDLCVGDTYCDDHKVLGCEDCFGKR